MASASAVFSTTSLQAAGAQPYATLEGKLDSMLLKNLRDMGMEFMTPVQSKVLNMPSLQADCLVQAKTGTGKTIAFLLPAIQKVLLTTIRNGQVAILILSPTRELALQIAAEAQRLVASPSSQKRQIQVHTAFGGTARASNLNKFRNGNPTILVATPGRLKDYLEEEDVRPRFNDMQTLILDEADRMLDAGFLPDVLRILRTLPSKKQSGWQGMCFSATVPPKVKEVLSHVLAKEYTSISTIDASEPPTLEKVPQFSIVIPHAQNIFTTLLALISRETKVSREDPKIIVFGVTANLVALYADLYRELIPLKVFELHSRLSQNLRTRTTDQFREASSGIMFATDVIGRGMDFPDVSLVVQAGLPADADSYTHRVGRTARAGKDGRAVIILTNAEAFYLKVNPQFPIKPYPGAEDIVRDADAAAAIPPKMQNIDEDTKRKAYSAYLGFMKSFEKRLQVNSAGLVQMANELALKGMGCPEAPALDRKTVGKMGLKNVPGLRYQQPSQNTDGHSGANRRGINKSAPKRGLEVEQPDHDARPTRRTAHQGMPGSVEGANNTIVRPPRVSQKPGRGGSRAPKR